MVRRPKTKITKKGAGDNGLLFFSRKGNVQSLRKGQVRYWTNIGGSFTWPSPIKITRKK